MKKIIAASMILFSSVAFGESETVMKCQMNIMRISGGKMIGDPHQLAEAILTADARQFYAVIGERIISSPILSEQKVVWPHTKLAPLTLCVKTPLVLFTMTSDMCLMNVKRLRNEQHR